MLLEASIREQEQVKARRIECNSTMFFKMRKITIIHQHDCMQCGIACLQMVCKYFGREYTLDSLSKLCFATAEGVSLLGINEAANTLGLHTTCG